MDGQTEYPELAQAVVSAGEAGILKSLRQYQLKRLGLCLSAPNSRQIILTAAIKESGQINPELAHVLTHSYRRSGELDQWLDFISQKIEASNEAVDVQAHWLIAQAIAQMEVPKQRKPIRGLASLERALSVSASDSTRLVVIRQMTDYFDEVKAWEEGVSFLESIEGQFTADADITVVDELKTRLNAASMNTARRERR